MKQLKLRKKIRKITMLIIVMFILSQVASNSVVSAADATDPNCLEPGTNQYFELRAVQIKEIRSRKPNSRW